MSKRSRRRKTAEAKKNPAPAPASSPPKRVKKERKPDPNRKRPNIIRILAIFLMINGAAGLLLYFPANLQLYAQGEITSFPVVAIPLVFGGISGLAGAGMFQYKDWGRLLTIGGYGAFVLTVPWLSGLFAASGERPPILLIGVGALLSAAFIWWLVQIKDEFD